MEVALEVEGWGLGVRLDGWEDRDTLEDLPAREPREAGGSALEVLAFPGLPELEVSGFLLMTVEVPLLWDVALISSKSGTRISPGTFTWNFSCHERGGKETLV